MGNSFFNPSDFHGGRARRPSLHSFQSSILLGVDATLADGIRHAVDRQHVGGDAIVHAVSFRVPDNIIEGRVHNLFQMFVDYRLLPEVSLAILHPLKVRSSNAAGVGQYVGNDKDFFLGEDIVGRRSGGPVRALGQDPAFHALRISAGDLVFRRRRNQNVAIGKQKLGRIVSLRARETVNRAIALAEFPKRFRVNAVPVVQTAAVSVGPNLAAYNYVRSTASPTVANQQYAIIAPVGHCAYKRAAEHTIVGERDMGDARLDYDAFTYGWFDHFLKGEDNGLLAKTPKIRYYTMGSNKWQSSDTWPPEGAKPVTYYLASDGHANSLNGDGALLPSPAQEDSADKFVYDPMNPVPTRGGGFCCMGPDFKPGAVDQRALEMRSDVLVYSTGPLQEGIEVSGPIDVTLYVSSDAKDTDFTVKLIEVLPDGTAYNIDENIQRVRYREGYDKAPVWMEKGKVYKVTLQPMQTSNYLAPGHQLRIEVSSSNFPHFDRNLNTGGDNYNESQGIVAHNEVHHSTQYPSSVTLSVVKR